MDSLDYDSDSANEGTHPCVMPPALLPHAAAAPCMLPSAGEALGMLAAGLQRLPHVPGLWPSLVYVSVTPSAAASRVGAAYTAAAAATLGTPFRAPDLPPHVSLSRTLMLRYEEIEEVAAHLRATLLGAVSFEITLEGARIYVSEDGARSFLALEAVEGIEHLVALTRRVDVVVARRRLPVFYSVRVCAWE